MARTNSRTVFERTDNPDEVPVSDRPKYQFYANHKVHKFLEGLAYGAKNKIINNIIENGMDNYAQVRTNDNLEAFATFLSGNEFNDDKPAQKILSLLNEFYQKKALSDSLEAAWKD